MPYEPLDVLIKDKEFTPLFSKESKNFFKINNFLKKVKDLSFTKKFYSHATEESHNLESFLDEHNAENYTRWVYMRELVASTRNMCGAAYTLKHIINWLPEYKVREDEQFEGDSNKVLSFLNKTIITLFDESAKEAKRLGSAMPLISVNRDEFIDKHRRRFLPYDIDEEKVWNADEKAVEISTKYMDVARSIIELDIKKRYDKEKLIDIIPSKINDELVNGFKYGLRPLVSKYDTYIKGTPIEKKDRRIAPLRGYITLPMHLVELASFLTHFYERHEDEIRHEETKKRIAALVNKGDILDNIVNYSLFYTTKFIEEALPLAEGIKKDYMLPSRCEVQGTKLGLHARVAVNIVNVANYHGTEVFIRVGDEKFDARSIMSVMVAGGHIGSGKDKKVAFEGDERTLGDIKILAECDYGEGDNYKILLERLSYLKKVGEGI